MPPALRASVELAVCAAELDLALAAELPEICGSGRALDERSEGRTQSWLGQLRAWLLHGDETTVTTYPGCEGSAVVGLWTVEGGGHIPAFRTPDFTRDALQFLHSRDPQ